MTDRELLELAAKAAGVEYFWTVNGNLVVTAEDGRQWNPLTDDGDALRLAVKLGIRVWKDDDIVWCNETPIYTSSDPYATVRFAIVRAAAEIGKEMK